MMTNHIKKTRCIAHMTQTELARKTGYSRQYIHRIETNQSIPSIEVAYIIADALNVSIQTIFMYQKKTH